ncbi:hypothetical protein AAFF_G00051110 [Aldrovandia affinis]|uniref:Uncharacterized protein n=1 Tax=Aldrovandia affinis TaxID=143900 RepID=A0AAD7T4F7_9TELE|nr:hypothetical protein AAFF_G00051110 [Aldrovandia affinis]
MSDIFKKLSVGVDELGSRIRSSGYALWTPAPARSAQEHYCGENNANIHLTNLRKYSTCTPLCTVCCFTRRWLYYGM